MSKSKALQHATRTPVIKLGNIFSNMRILYMGHKQSKTVKYDSYLINEYAEEELPFSKVIVSNLTSIDQFK